MYKNIYQYILKGPSQFIVQQTQHEICNIDSMRFVASEPHLQEALQICIVCKGELNNSTQLKNINIAGNSTKEAQKRSGEPPMFGSHGVSDPPNTAGQTQTAQKNSEWLDHIKRSKGSQKHPKRVYFRSANKEGPLPEKYLGKHKKGCPVRGHPATHGLFCSSTAAPLVERCQMFLGLFGGDFQLYLYF